MFELEINYQSKIAPRWGAFLRALAQKTARVLKIKNSLVISLAFVGPAEIKKLNSAYRGKNKVTDVLSFAEVNEILICLKQAQKQARQHQHRLQDEIALLFVHGLLHLLGYDHRTAREYREMSSLERKILQKSV